MKISIKTHATELAAKNIFVAPGSATDEILPADFP